MSERYFQIVESANQQLIIHYKNVYNQILPRLRRSLDVHSEYSSQTSGGHDTKQHLETEELLSILQEIISLWQKLCKTVVHTCSVIPFWVYIIVLKQVSTVLSMPIFLADK